MRIYASIPHLLLNAGRRIADPCMGLSALASGLHQYPANRPRCS